MPLLQVPSLFYGADCVCGSSECSMFSLESVYVEGQIIFGKGGGGWKEGW
jgi:hypothetical protein